MIKKKQEDDTNYSFLLRCMAALTAAAVVTAGIIAAVTLKSAVVAATAVAAKTLLASALIFTPFFPIALFAIGLVFVLPFLFSCNNNTYTAVRTIAPGYRSYGNYNFYPPTSVYTSPDYYTGTVYTSSDHIHSHPSTNSTVHGHDGSHMHGHESSHVHEHGGSHRHGHF